MPGRACETCGTANEADARFCEGCGGALARRCDGCSTPASATARFCRSCGAALELTDKPPVAPTRKTVTVLFADLAGSTTFEEQVDAETAREVIGDYHDLLRTTAANHHAGVVKYIGDGFMAVWGVPEIGPEDAGHAVAAAVELQERFVGLAARVAATHRTTLALRVAVNTGEVVVGAGDADLVGDALNVAARLESECPHGQVVVGEETWRATRGHQSYEPLGRVQVKGRTAAVPVYQWTARRSEHADAVPFVGRGDEFRRLQAVFDDALAHRAARLVTVIGDPGVGKTRLAAAFAAHRGIAVIDVRCVTEGSVALAPLVDAIRTRDLKDDVPVGAGERDRILRGLADLDTGAATSVEETFWAVRRYIEVLAVGQPLVVVVDDVQWADPLLLDFLEHLTEWVRDAPVLVLALARPEIRDSRADLVSVGGWVADAIRLRGLNPEATAELAAHVLGGDRIPPELLDRLPASTGGNPLFVRELVGMLVHDGVLVSHPGGWQLTIDAEAIAVPPTIQALLASRLERMNSGDRRVLEVASVIGTDFFPGPLSTLAGLSASAVRSALDRLRRHELAAPSGAYLGDEPIWRFHHVLVRDVGYRRLLKSDRAQLHERFADWVDAGGRTGAVDPEQLAARHTEAAHGYRCDLGLNDAHTAALALRSARGYRAAARRALDRDALASAGAQAARGAAMAGADPELRAELLQVACEAFLSDGDVTDAAPLVDELEAVAGDALDPVAACYRCQFLVYTDPSRLREVDQRLDGVIEEFVGRGDASGLAKAYRVRAAARARLGRVGDAELDLFDALIAARRGGDHRQITAVLGAAPNAALWGPSPVPKAGGRCLDVVRMQRMTTGAPSLEATSLRCLAVLEVLRGRPEKAREMLADARTILGDLGLRHGLMETELHAGIVELMVGDPVAAEPHFRTALDGLGVLGVGADAGQAAALLARAVLAQGRLDEADRYAAQSEQIAGHNLKSAIAWRAVRAEILAAQGRHADAVALATEAVAVASDTDLVLDHAEACLALSRVLAAAGDGPGVATARAQAESLYAAKEAVFAREYFTATEVVADTRRLRLANKASEIFATVSEGVRTQGPAMPFAVDSNTFVYEDRRALAGSPILGTDSILSGAHAKLRQFPHFETRTLAVRGQTLALEWTQWSDDAGNETNTLDLFEGSDDGATLRYLGRFDTDDFDGAYAELERRYYAGEGREFAVNGVAASRFVAAMADRDVEAARALSHPDFRWLASASALKPVARSVEEFFSWLCERDKQLSVQSFFIPAIHWLSPEVMVSIGDIRGIGNDGETYDWTKLYVAEYRDGKAVSTREFEADQEDAAFACAESLAREPVGLLTVSNAATDTSERIIAALRAGDVEAFAGCYAADVVQDDRRRMGGVPILGRDQMRAGVRRIFAQYSSFDTRVLAVRGDRLVLASSRWSDEAGNRTEQLHLAEVDGAGRVFYDGRFDTDDFDGAYAELEKRYYAGEGAAFAESGRAAASWIAAVNRADLDAARRLCDPGFRWFAPPGGMKATERTLADVFDWRAQRNTQVSGLRHWVQTLHWVSPTCAVGLGAISAVGTDGENFQWRFPFVTQCRDGFITSVHEFDSEAAAFEYAETVVAAPGVLPLSNAATRTYDACIAALLAHDIDTATDFYDADIVFDDHRRLGGFPVRGRAMMRALVEQLVFQYSDLSSRVLAVRGDRLVLIFSRFRDESGNEAEQFHLGEIGADGRIVYEGRFDADDFDGAYAEMGRRYIAGEGAEYAVNAAVIDGFMRAMDTLDVEAARRLCVPGFAWESIPSTLAAERRTLDEFFGWVAERARQASKVCNFGSVLRWVSPDCVAAMGDVLATGSGGEIFHWSRPYVARFSNGLFASMRQFADEGSAIAYAESLIHRPSRLAVENRCSEVAQVLVEALQRDDVGTAADLYSDRFGFDDRRRISREAIPDRTAMRNALQHLRQQYCRIGGEVLAVRGERFALGRYELSDDAGNESIGLVLREIDERGRIVHEARFDDSAFREAFRELHRRYYAGEGAEFAQHGLVSAAVSEALSHNDIETVRRLTTPGFRWHAPDSALKSAERNIDDLVAWADERGRQVATQRSWLPVTRWLSPECAVALVQVSAHGHDGENYRWTIPFVSEFRDGLLESCREFDSEDDAFRYAEDVVARQATPPELRNMATAASARSFAASLAGDLDAVQSQYSAGVVSEDRRRLGGDPFIGRDEIRDATVGLLSQFSDAQTRTVAVRGDRLQLLWISFSDDSGNQSTQYHVVEVDDQGLIDYAARFDADDFDGAYRELETRYYAGEGRPFAADGMVMAAWVEAIQHLDLEAARSLSQPDFNWTCPPTALTAETRSLGEFFAWQRQRAGQASSVRSFLPEVRWPSADCMVATARVVAVNPDADRYSWDRVYTVEFRDNLVAAVREFDDQTTAFAYATERAGVLDDRLSTSNSASAASDAFTRGLQSGDLAATVALFADGWVSDDHRRLQGTPIQGHDAVQAGITQLLRQFSRFESRTLAVRGDRLALVWSRWADDDGNQTEHFHIVEVDGEGRLANDSRFDADDFDGAYAELDRRYFAGEGAPFADHEHLVTEYVRALNRGDWHTVFGTLTAPDLHVENHCSSGFPDRSAADLRTSLTELGDMLSSVRWWYSAVHWVSPSLWVSRMEREGWGRDGEHYTWTRILVSRIRDGRVEAIWEFDPDDQAAAFACAEAQLTVP